MSRATCADTFSQRFAVKLNHNTVSTLALEQEVFSAEKHAVIVTVAQ
jgi:hypothetical protein